MTARRSLAKTALLLLPVHVVLRAGEAVLPILLARWFGRSSNTDVYNFAFALFALAGSLIFTAFQDSALVPILAEVKIEGRAAMPRVLGSLLAHTLAYGAALAAAIGGAALLYFRLRYAGSDLAVATHMIAPFCAFLLALAVRTFFVAVLNAEHRYFVQPVASCVGIVLNIALVAFGRDALGVVAIPLGAVAGELAAISVLVLVARWLLGLRMPLSFERPEPVKRFAKLIAAEVGGAAVTRINPVVDQLMAGMAGVLGGGTLLRYTGDVASLPTSLLQAALLPVLLSHLSEDFAAGDVSKFKATVSRSLLTICTLLLGMSALLYVAREPLFRLVFLGGQMDAAGVDRMVRLLPYHLVGLAPFGALLVLARAHVAMKNSGIMLGMGVLNAALNAGFNIVLLKAIGLEGIALSTSCVQLAIAAVFWVRLNGKLAREHASVA